MGEVEFLIHSNSKVTTADIIKNFQKNMYPLTPSEIKQKIVPTPKFKYLITLNKTPESNIDNTYLQLFIRPHIKKELNCDEVLFTGNTIEIWSSKEIDLAKLKKKELLTLKKSTPYGGGALSVKLVKK